MTDESDSIVNDIAWPVNIQSMSSSDFHPINQTEQQEKEENKTKKRRRRSCGWCPWLWCCLALSLLLLLLLLGLLLGLLGKQSRTTTLIAGINSTTLNMTSTLTTTASTTLTSAPTIMTTTTTASTTLTSAPSTMTTTTASTTLTSAPTTMTTTTVLSCGESCLNQSWIIPSGDIAYWSFDTSLNDSINDYNPTSSLNLPILATGYIRQSALFNASGQQSIFTGFIPLTNVSFTVEAWIKPTGFPNQKDHAIVGLCSSATNDYCLHIMIRYLKLYFGFYFDDTQGQTTLEANQWIHTAFVYNATTRIQRIYLNGYEDGASTVSSSLLVITGLFTIGINEVMEPTSSYFQGNIDELSINQRAKSACEVLERATLAARFNFDSSSPYTDSGPNQVAATHSSTSIISGYRNEAISLAGTSSSYFQTWGFTSLGVSNQAFSIAFWIKPQVLSGTLVHLSTSSTGTGPTCFPMLGFASNGAIVAQVLTSSGIVVSATGSILPTSALWIPIVQTWSAINGVRLYVNNTLVSSVSATTFLGSGTTPNYLTLGSCLNGCSSCPSGSVGTAGPYRGAIDNWQIYSRELSSSDVCALYYSV